MLYAVDCTDTFTAEVLHTDNMKNTVLLGIQVIDIIKNINQNNPFTGLSG